MLKKSLFRGGWRGISFFSIRQRSCCFTLNTLVGFASSVIFLQFFGSACAANCEANCSVLSCKCFSKKCAIRYAEWLAGNGLTVYTGKMLCLISLNA